MTSCSAYLLHLAAIIFPTFMDLAILNTFFQHADFITGSSGEGSLDQVHVTDQKEGFMAFVRLVGTIYFKKHLSAFYSVHAYELPDQVLKACQGSSSEKQHLT